MGEFVAFLFVCALVYGAWRVVQPRRSVKDDD